MGRTILAVALVLGLCTEVATAKTVTIQTIPIAPQDTTQAPPIPDAHLSGPQTEADPAQTEPGDGPSANGSARQAEDAAPPPVLYNTSMLPKPVARMHAQLTEAALSGSMDRLRMVLESNELPPTLSFGDTGDPIDFLKSSSGDGEGFEILAILADVLDAGFLHVDAGTPQEMYVWPYFARYPLSSLRPDQKVEMFRIITAGDFAEMEEFGAWTFYRVGIGPDGTLHYFVAGD